MKKVWKGFAAAVSAAAIAATGFIGASAANAAEGDVTVTITDATSADQKFVAYRVLDATNNGENYAYTINTTYSEVLKTATGLPLNGTPEANNAAVTEYIGGLSTTSTPTMKQFADKLWLAIADKGITPDVAEFAGKEGGASFEGPQGYYLIRQTKAGASDALSAVIVNTAGQNGVDVTLKKDVPTVEKKVQNVNDSSNTTSDWQDSADHDVNDQVNFKLSGTTASNVNDFKQYKFEFKDTMSAGLTFVQAGATVATTDVTVKIDGVAITSGYTVSLADAEATTGAYAGGTVLTVSFADLLAATKAAGITLDGDDVVTVEYKATLNENAVIGSDGNPNKVDLTFANDPHYNGAGADQPTGVTPEDEVIVFTYEVNADKVTSSNTPLEGASFALLKWFGGEENVWKVYQHAADGTAAGWVALPSTVTIANKDAIATLPQTEAAKIPGTATAQNKDGKWTVNFPRIDDGDYAIVETAVPAGYNYAAPTQFTITGALVTTQPTGQPITGTWGAPTTTNKDVTVSGGTISASIVNNAGNELPETGGMGTTILYAAGAAIVLIAGIGLAVTLRRRQA